MTEVNLNYIRNIIENMDHQKQVNVLKILTKHKDICINANKSGIRVNLTELKPNVINELIEYVKYVQEQENVLVNYEKQKETYKNEFFINH